MKIAVQIGANPTLTFRIKVLIGSMHREPDKNYLNKN